MTKKPRVTTAIRFPPELHAKLAAAASEQDRSLNWLVNSIVKRHFEPTETMAAPRADANGYEIRSMREHIDSIDRKVKAAGEPHGIALLVPNWVPIRQLNILQRRTTCSSVQVQYDFQWEVICREVDLEEVGRDEEALPYTHWWSTATWSEEHARFMPDPPEEFLMEMLADG